MSAQEQRYRELDVPDSGRGLRLDRFLALRFPDLSRTSLARGIRRGEVTDAEGRTLRAAATVFGGQRLHIFIEGIAPSTAPPPFPPILYEDDRVAVIDKPAGLACHPAGTRFVWAVIGLARHHWPDCERIELVHRLDRDTSGVLLLTKDREANTVLKQVFKEGGAKKEYLALCRGVPDWDHTNIEAPIGSADSDIRIQMGVRPDGLPARTEAWLEDVATDREPPISRIRCRLHTGRTHQIRVHLAHIGLPLLGDRMYGVPPEVFLYSLAHGVDASVVAQTGAPHHALHAQHLSVPHPGGGTITVSAPLPETLRRWWEDPGALPQPSRPAEGTDRTEQA